MNKNGKHMPTVITNRATIRSAIDKFKRKIIDISDSIANRKWVFPNGDSANYKTYVIQTTIGVLYIAIPPSKLDRQTHLFSLEKKGSLLTPDAEVNIPLKFDRRLSGVYVKDNKGFLLCSRGSFTSYRGRIQKKISFAYFIKWLIPVNEMNHTIELIPITSLETDDLAYNIALFTLSVKELKIEFKSQSPIPNLNNTDNNNWRTNEEYEGSKSLSPTRPSKNSYDYAHGPLCNSLKRYLEKYIDQNTKLGSKFKYGSNQNIDAGIYYKKDKKAIAIFEAKTSASLSKQLYSAFGQLEYYRYIYGTKRTYLFLVLPVIEKNQLTDKLIKFFEHKNIQLIFGKNEQFESSDGDSLAFVIAKLLN